MFILLSSKDSMINNTSIKGIQNVREKCVSVISNIQVSDVRSHSLLLQSQIVILLDILVKKYLMEIMCQTDFN